MTTTLHQPITLEEFLQLPQTKPASEFIDGYIYKTHAPGQTFPTTAKAL